MNKKRTNKLKNQKGMTFVSVMIATMMITMLIAVSFSSITKTTQAPEASSSGYALCRNISQNILNTIRAEGTKTETYKAPIHSGSVNFSDWMSGQNDYNISSDDIAQHSSSLGDSIKNRRWPSEPVLNWSGGATTGPSEYLGPHTIRSYMNTLASIFFEYQDNGICAGDGIDLDLIDVDNLALGELNSDNKREINLYTVGSKIRIRPYRIDTGDINCAIDPNTQWPRPFADQEPPQAAPNANSTAPIPIEPLVNLDRYDPNIGFEVKISVGLDRENIRSLANANGQNSDFECDRTERLSYDREPDLIAEPQIIDNGPTVTIRYENNKHVLGGTLLCKLTDTIIQPQAPSSTTFRVRSEFEDYEPCDLITTACGQNLNPTIGPDHKSVTFTWPTNPNCHTRFEAAIMDAVGNISSRPSHSRGRVGGTLSSERGNPTDSASSGSNNFYSVDGATYRTEGAAITASQLSGQPITPTAEPPPGASFADQDIADVNTQVKDAEQHAAEAASASAKTNATEAANTELQTSYTESLAGPNNTSSAALNDSVQSAAANEAKAKENYQASQASAFAAAQSLDATIAEADKHKANNPSSTATSAGAISASSEAAAKAQEQADKDKAAYDEAKRIAAALKAEQDRRKAEEDKKKNPFPT